MSKYKYKNILLTGAAGALGNQLRETLSKECDTLKISDKVNLEKKFHNEKVEIADLASTESILKLTKEIEKRKSDKGKAAVMAKKVELLRFFSDDNNLVSEAWGSWPASFFPLQTLYLCVPDNIL